MNLLDVEKAKQRLRDDMREFWKLIGKTILFFLIAFSLGSAVQLIVWSLKTL